MINYLTNVQIDEQHAAGRRASESTAADGYVPELQCCTGPNNPCGALFGLYGC